MRLNITWRQRLASILLGTAISIYAYKSTDVTQVLRDPVELIFFLHNIAFAIAFMVRTNYSVIDKNILHWIVCGLAYFSGFFFFSGSQNVYLLNNIALIIEIIACFLGLLSVLSLGRSYGVMPAIRKIQTRWAYRFVRHPMYLSSILFKTGYVVKYPLLMNFLLLIAVFCLYHLRCNYEEKILNQETEYQSYLTQVKFRIIPGIY